MSYFSNMLRLGGGGNNDDYSDISDTESNSSSSSANTVVSVVEERRKRTILDKVKDTILPDKEDSREEEAMTAGTSKRQKAPENDLLIKSGSSKPTRAHTMKTGR